MKAHEFISRLDDAKYGRKVVEDTAPVAAAPSHAPTHTAQWKTDSKGKSDDQGERMGGEKDAIKQSKTSIPAPVAKAPSHAPTSGTDATTTGKGSSEDQGEKLSKEAMKEALNGLLNGEGLDIDSLLGEDAFDEGAHKPGCQCGFCKNKGKMGKKTDDDDGADKDGGGEKDEMHENYGPGAGAMRRPLGRGLPIKRRLGGAGRMGFRSQIRPPAKAAINPYQPAMERLDTSDDPRRTIQEIADELLEAPDTE